VAAVSKDWDEWRKAHPVKPAAKAAAK